MSAKHILILGTGSAGKRHARNLHELGCRISCMDPRQDRIDELAVDVPLVGGYQAVDDALAAGDLHGVAVTSPPMFHVEQSTAALRAGLPVLLEKPVCPTLADAETLRRVRDLTGTPLLLGYTYRWWPPLMRVRELLAEGVIGALRYAQFVMSAHLADWHPWERYQDFFMAHQSLGGGALLDESHWLDLMFWFLGAPQTVRADIDKVSDLEIDTDDNVEMMIRYASGLRVGMHLDLYGRPHQKYIRFYGEEGTLLWSFDPNAIRIARGMEEAWEDETFTCERNDMFVGVAREFLAVLDGQEPSTCTLEDGLAVLGLIEQARQSSSTHRAQPALPQGA